MSRWTFEASCEDLVWDEALVLEPKLEVEPSRSEINYGCEILVDSAGCACETVSLTQSESRICAFKDLNNKSQW